jgi:hypothetical protein
MTGVAFFIIHFQLFIIHYPKVSLFSATYQDSGKSDT